MTTGGFATADDVWPPDSGGCPHPPALREAILRLGRTISFDEVRRRGFGHLASWYGPYVVAEEMMMERAQQAETMRTPKVAALQARLQALEIFFFDANGDLSDTMVDLIAMPLAKVRGAIQDEIDELRHKVEDLERTRVKYHGVHEYGVLYPEGSFVTRGGSLWYATKETREAPGEGQTSWTLAVKRGDAR